MQEHTRKGHSVTKPVLGAVVGTHRIVRSELVTKGQLTQCSTLTS